MAAVNPGSDNLIEWYTFDAVSMTAGDHAGKTLTLINTPTSSISGIVGRAIDFELTNSEYSFYNVAYSSSGFPYGDNAISISTWIKLESNATNMDIVNGWGKDKSYWRLFSSPGTSDFTFQTTDGVSSKYVNAGSSVTTGEWYHLVAWHDPIANEIGLVVNDGTPVTTSNSDGMTTDTDVDARFSIGRMAVDAINNFCDALVDEVAIFDDVIVGDEIEWLYNSGAGRGYADLAETSTLVGNIIIIM